MFKAGGKIWIIFFGMKNGNLFQKTGRLFCVDFIIDIGMLTGRVIRRFKCSAAEYWMLRIRKKRGYLISFSSWMKKFARVSLSA